LPLLYVKANQLTKLMNHNTATDVNWNFIQWLFTQEGIVWLKALNWVPP